MLDAVPCRMIGRKRNPVADATGTPLIGPSTSVRNFITPACRASRSAPMTPVISVGLAPGGCRLSVGRGNGQHRVRTAVQSGQRRDNDPKANVGDPRG